MTNRYGKPWIKVFVLSPTKMFDVDLVLFTDNTAFYVDKHLPLRHYNVGTGVSDTIRYCNTVKEANEAFKNGRFASRRIARHVFSYEVYDIIWNTGYFIEKL